MAFFSRTHDFAIDLGSSETKVLIGPEDDLLSEPSIVAVWRESRQPVIDRIRGICAGNLVAHLLCDLHNRIQTVRPIRHGMVVDLLAASALVRYFLDKRRGGPRRTRKRAIVCVPGWLTLADRNTFQEAILRAGASEVALVDRAVAARVGAGLTIEGGLSHMTADLGGETSTVSVSSESLWPFELEHSLQVRGAVFDEAIIESLRAQGLDVGSLTAERVKRELGTFLPPISAGNMQVRGRDLLSRLPRSTSVSSEDVLRALRIPLERIAEGIQRLLSNVPAEVREDIVHKGIVLVGGNSGIPSIAEALSRAVGVPVLVAGDPAACAAKGASLLGRIARWVQR